MAPTYNEHIPLASKRVKLSMDSFSPSKQITVIVTKDERKKAFLVHKDVMCWSSDFMKKACELDAESAKSNIVDLEDGSTRIGSQNTIQLEKTEPEIFSFFLTWIMTGNVSYAAEFLSTAKFSKEDFSDEAYEAYDDQCLQVIQCCILGHELQAEEFYNAMINLLIINMKQAAARFDALVFSHDEFMELIWSKNTSQSSIRRLMLDFWISSITHEFLVPEDKSDALVDFYIDLARHAMANVNGESGTKVPWEQDRCTYHKHTGNPEGYTCTEGRKSKGKKVHFLL